MRNNDSDADFRRRVYFEDETSAPVNPFAADYASLGPVEDDDLPAEKRPEFQAIINRGGHIRVGRGVRGFEIG